MTIEIADRLIKLRKKNGYSQEELADKLGLSRQAVSKWERAEASPDTDNLICLAKLYGVSLDELLSTEDDVETIVNEQVKKEEPEKDSIKLTDDEGNSLVIKDNHIRCCDKDGNLIERDPKITKGIRIVNIIEAALGIVALVAYILLGTLVGMWFNAWVVFFVPEIICSIARCVVKKNANNFNMPFAAAFTFFFVCMVIPGTYMNLWHPMWVVFLAIPLYYMIVKLINRIIRKKDEDDDEDDKD